MSLYGTYIGNNRMFITPQWGGKIHAFADDLSVTTGLLLDGVFEVGLTNYILTEIKQGMNVVDVGCNIGYFSVLLGYRVGELGTVHAYEPNPNLHELIVDNLTLNELKHNVILHKKGAYSEESTVNFYISKRFQGNSSINKHSETYLNDFKSDQFEISIIDVVPLDSESIGEKIDFMKIDVEGGEYRVFLGMKKRLDEGSIDRIVFELNKSMLKNDVDCFYELLSQYTKTYSFNLLSHDGLLIPTSLDEIFSHNFIENIVMKKVQ